MVHFEELECGQGNDMLWVPLALLVVVKRCHVSYYVAVMGPDELCTTISLSCRPFSRHGSTILSPATRIALEASPLRYRELKFLVNVAYLRRGSSSSSSSSDS